MSSVDSNVPIEEDTPGVYLGTVSHVDGVPLRPNGDQMISPNVSSVDSSIGGNNGGKESREDQDGPPAHGGSDDRRVYFSCVELEAAHGSKLDGKVAGGALSKKQGGRFEGKKPNVCGPKYSEISRSARRCAKTAFEFEHDECLRREERRFDVQWFGHKMDNQPKFVQDAQRYMPNAMRKARYATSPVEEFVDGQRLELPRPGFTYNNVYQRKQAVLANVTDQWSKNDYYRRNKRVRLREQVEQSNADFWAEKEYCKALGIRAPNVYAKRDILNAGLIRMLTADKASWEDRFIHHMMSMEGQRERELGLVPRPKRSDVERAVQHVDADPMYSNECFTPWRFYGTPAYLESGEELDGMEVVATNCVISPERDIADDVKEAVHLVIAGFLATVEKSGLDYSVYCPMLLHINAAVLGITTARRWSGVAVHILQLLRVVEVELDMGMVMNYLRSGNTPTLESKTLDDFNAMMAADDDDDLPWWMSATEIIQVLINAPIGQRVIKFMSQLIALKFISRERLQFKMWDMALFDLPEAIGCVSIANAIDMFISILRRAHKVIIQCFSEQSLTPLAYDDLDVPKFDKAFLTVQDLGKALKQGNLEMIHGVTEDEFEEMLKKTEALGDRMLKKKTNGMVKELIMKKVAVLQEVRSQYELYLSAKGIKPLDYLVTLCGPTACGKTVLAYPLMQSLLAYNGLPHTRDRIAQLQESDTYDTLAKSNVLCYYLDDLANFKLNNKGQSPAQMIIRLVNTARNPAIKADVDEKGKVFFNHAFTLITTNVEMFDIADIANCESSILRRQAVTVYVQPRPHLCVGTSVIMDPALMEAHLRLFGKNKGVMQNFQWFTPRRVLVRQDAQTNYETVDYVPARITKQAYPLTYEAVTEFERSLIPYYMALDSHFTATSENVYRMFGLGYTDAQPYSAVKKHAAYLNITPTGATLKCIDLNTFLTFMKEDSAIHRRREIEVANKQQNEDNFGWCSVCNRPTATCVCDFPKPPPPMVYTSESTVATSVAAKYGVSRPVEDDSSYEEETIYEPSIGPVKLEMETEDDDESGVELISLPENLLRLIEESEVREEVQLEGGEEVEAEGEVAKEESPRQKFDLMMIKLARDVHFWMLYAYMWFRAQCHVFPHRYADNIHRFPHGLDRHLIVDGKIGDLFSSVLTYRLSGYVTRWNTANRCRWLLRGYGHPTFLIGAVLACSLASLSWWFAILMLGSWIVSYYQLAKQATASRLHRSNKPLWETLKPFTGDAADVLVPIIGFAFLATSLMRLRRRYYPETQAQPDAPYSYVPEDHEQPPNPKAATMTQQQAAHVLSHNMGSICVTGPKGRKTVSIVGIKGTVWLCPRHVFSVQGEHDVYDIQAWRHGSKQRPITQLHKDAISPIGVKDLLLLNLPDLGLVKDVSHLLPRAEPRGTRFCRLLLKKGEKLEDHNLRVEAVNVLIDKPPEYNWPGATVKSRRQVYDIKAGTTECGSCGSPVVSFAGKEKMLVGVHVMKLVAGRAYDKCGLETITESEFMRAQKTFERKHEVVAPKMHLEMRTVEGLPQVEKGSIHPRHSLNFVENPDETDVLGHWHARSTPVSKVQPSLVAIDVEEAFGLRHKMFGPPPFRHFEDGTPNWPYTVGLEQITHRGAHYVMEVVPDIREMLLTTFAADLRDVRPLTQYEIRNGLNDKSVNPLNMKSSAGHPYNMEKRKMSPSNKPPYELHASAWLALERFEKSIDDGDVEVQIFKATLKDEPVLTGQKKKARLFQASSLALTLWIRKHLGWLCSHMARYNLSLGVAIGMDCQGLRWHDMITEFDTGKEDIIQYDYKKFDQHVSPAMKSEVVKFVCMLMERKGAEPGWIEHVKRGLSQWIFPTSLFDGVVVRLRNSNPSGIGVTTAFNCIDNMFRSYCAVFLVTGRRDFAKFCKIMTYGDDAFLRCSDERVTLQTMAQAFQNMGMEITPTQKNAKLEDVAGRIRMRDVDFLSRNSVWHPALKRYLGALQDESLFKGLLVRHSDISPEEHTVAASGSVLYEAFARGEEFYDDFRCKLGAILVRYQLDATVDWQMTYAERAIKRLSLHDEMVVEYTPSVEARDLRGHLRIDLPCQPCFDDAAPLESSLFSVRVSVLDPSDASPYEAILEMSHHSRPATSNNTQTTNTMETIGQTMFRIDRPDHISDDHAGQDMSRDTSVVPSMQLSDWFQRPIQIADYVWDNTQLDDNFNPWTLYLSTNSVKEKLAGYAWFRGTLHLKIVITGQQFVYGRALIAYDPFPVATRLNRISTDDIENLVRWGQMSQRQHLWLNPTTNTGGEMKLPFFFPQDLSPLQPSSTDSIGKIFISSVGGLRTVRDTPPKATITIYAWMPDLVLAGPSTRPVMESGDADEAEQTKLSAKLKTIERISSALTSLPAIGPYATAASTFARNAASLALYYGFSRPESVGAAARYWQSTGSPLAHSVGQGDSTALAYNPKCTTVVDSRVAGLDGTDEMSLHYIRSRESFFNLFSWSELNTRGSLLASFFISPMYASAGNVPGVVLPTSLAFGTYPFQKWRGTIKMRFQVVASAVHTGMLRFIYDADAGTTGLLDVADQSKVRVINMDLSKERDLTIEFPYMSYRPYLDTSADFYTGGPTLTNTQANGILRIYVMNELISSSSTVSPATILVSIAGGDDFEAWQPVGRYTQYRPTLEAGDDPQNSVEVCDSAPEGECVTTMVTNYAMPQHTKIFHDDPILSVRYLLKRFVATTFINRDPGGTGYIRINPNVYPGNTIRGGTIYSYQGPFQYWASGYVGWRGSLSKRFLGPLSGAIARTGGGGAGPNFGGNVPPPTYGNLLSLPVPCEVFPRGVAIANVNFPWYKALRFLVACEETETATETYQAVIEVNTSGNVELTSAGEDFMYLYYIGAPRMVSIA